MTRRWRIGIEAGGTFTDCVAVDPHGAVRRAKVLSSGAIRGRVVRAEERSLQVEGLPTLDLTGMELRLVPDGDARRIVAHDGALTLQSVHGIGAGAIVEISSGEAAPVLAARIATLTPLGRPLPPAEVRLATTWATNALLEGTFTPTVLLTTRGFGDLLEIGDQRRPDLFALDIRKPRPMHAGVIEVDERVSAMGEVLAPLALDAAVGAARAWLGRGVTSAAVALLHSDRFPRHEQALGAALRAAGFEHVSLSSALSARMRIVPRARTAVVNSALSGAIGRFVGGAAAGWRGRGPGEEEAAEGACELRVMTSAGGLAPADRFDAKDSLLSGPAGGVSGAAAIAARAGLERVIAFDMGGTSTDVTRIDREAEITVSHRVGETELAAPAVAVHSVAAGGGSICALEIVGAGESSTGNTASRPPTPSARPVVGPRSAGADPGPACYGRGGPLTITDVNLLMGRIDPASFKVPVDIEAAREALAEVRQAAEAAGAELPDDDALLENFVRVANQRMAQAIRTISVRKGYDPRDYALVAFGGAGGQHACGVARELGIRTVVAPADGSVLSALGVLAARMQVVREAQLLRPLGESGASQAIASAFAVLAAEARAELLRRDPGALETEQRCRARLRYAGQDHALDLDWTPGVDLASAFEAKARAIFGHVIAGRTIEVESIRVTALARAGELPASGFSDGAAIDRREPMHVGGAWRSVHVANRRGLESGGRAGRIIGPALYLGESTAVVVEPEWTGTVTADGDLRLDLDPGADADARSETSLHESLRHELIAGRLTSLGDAMGELLGRTALSTNVKERLDYSCALLDARANLVISAPHIPVHLGALGVCVRLLRGAIAMNPGDVLITNHPGFGGSHLPDVTLVAPAFDDAGSLLGYAACRAHHAEIGGTRPGSMPPGATSLSEEGAVIPPMHLVRAGAAAWEEVRNVFSGGPWPTRAIEDNMADLGAQLAAIRMGVEGLRSAAADWGREALASAMEALSRRAESHARAAIRSELISSHRSASSSMDDGAPLRVSITREATGEGVRLRIDFTGSAPVHPGNLNAPLAVIHSAAMYVVRVLVGQAAAEGAALDVPLNDGLLRAVELIVPEGMLNPPFGALGSDPSALPAVAGGNVETSQRVVNLLLEALGLAAHSQGTMNNLLFGDARGGYYETIGGGAGAGPGFAGASGVHTHMTNTAITDPEVLEHRYPVRLEQFAIRRGSGGAARRRGGDGLIREIAFLAPMSLSLLTSSRRDGPAGLLGAAAGATGRQRVVRADGQIEELGSSAAVDVQSGDRLIMETPGGGGYGPTGSA